MQIRYIKGQGVVLAFAMSEMQTLVEILRALHQFTGQEFLARAIADIEKDMQPKQLPVINYFHICEHCFRELDERDPNSFLMTHKGIDGKETSKWVHYVCGELKLNRPV